MSKKPQPKRTIWLRLEANLVKHLDALAKANHRTRANQIEALIVGAIAEHIVGAKPKESWTA